MKTGGVIGFLLIGLCLHLTAQSGMQCMTMPMDTLLRTQYPEWGSLDKFETELQRKISQGERRIRLREVVTLPVIVHIIHNGENIGQGSNLSQAQVYSQFDVLNEDFRRLAGTPGFNNHPDGADIEIEFCPATIDTVGDPLLEPGINRIDRNTFGWQAGPYATSYINDSIKPFTHWDPDKYLNIWIAELPGTTLGYAQFPNFSTLTDLSNFNGTASRDGVVIRPTSFGRVGNVVAPYNQGRTATHEIGHWLGLRHISGDVDCSSDDFCSDTPNSDKDRKGCATGNVSCGSTDMVENYMGLSDDGCMNIFTNCQKTRMRTVLENSPRRGILANAGTCNQDIPPAPDFRSSQSISCENQKVFYTDQSSNNPISWLWTFEGGNPATSTDPNPQVIYPQAGVFDITLEVTNSFGSTSKTFQDYITVNSSAPSVLFEEDFEMGFPAEWGLENPDNATTWELKEVQGSPSGNRAMFINLYFYAANGAKDALILPKLNLEGYANVTLSFDHAYRQGGAAERDSLLVSASTNGGLSFPHKLLAVAENGSNSFATGPPTNGNFFEPGEGSDWCFAGNNGKDCFTLDLSAFDGASSFILKFESVSDFGNNIYLDNISITGTCNVVSVEPDLRQSYNLSLFPNPTRNHITLSMEQLPALPVRLRILDIMGREVYQERLSDSGGNLRRQIDLHSLSEGSYMLQVWVGNRMETMPFVVQKY